MKPLIREVRPGEYLYRYHEKLPWVIEINGFNCLCSSEQDAIETLEREFKEDETPLPN